VQRGERRLCSEQRVRGSGEEGGIEGRQRPVNLPPENWSIALQQFMPPAVLKNTGSPRDAARCGAGCGAARRKRFYFDRMHNKRTAPPRMLLPTALSRPIFRASFPHLASLHHRRRSALTHVLIYSRSHLIHIYCTGVLFPRRCLLLDSFPRMPDEMTETGRILFVSVSTSTDYPLIKITRSEHETLYFIY